MKYFIKALKNYANFNGRANRSEFWYFILFNLLIVYGFIGLGAITEIDIFPIIGIIILIGTIIPNLALTVRRLHDTDKSGWYYFVALIPLIGGIWLIVLMASEGTIGENQYGPDPNNPAIFDFENQEI
jgi:uncharacterized membrane protein YhaH (DUF805 family)